MSPDYQFSFSPFHLIMLVERFSGQGIDPAAYSTAIKMEYRFL
jgi:S-adenosylmethionine:tRNA-ribosyltransferase-isomerase (queuine synthetase)